ncbi:MAG: DUF503 domain-containing protein [Chloroflexi bacterium]|nr:DUF503 domain-containing protein [Chloroflexota bacterium]MQC16905.1 DUF503 domain-containing protein [Chloroflexota bacterium]
MVTISILFTISIPEARSLKEKRAVIRSLVERYRTRMRLSAAEVGMQDDVRHAQVGVAIVSGDIAAARNLADSAKRFADEHLLGRAEVIDIAEDEVILE